MISDDLGTLESAGMKKKPSFYGIRSHLGKFYEFSVGSESDPNSPSAVQNGKPAQSLSSCVRTVCRLFLLVGAITIFAGVGLLIGVFSSPIESPIVKSRSNTTVELINMKIFQRNNQIELLQDVGVYLLLTGSVLLLLSTVIAIIYLVVIGCCCKNRNNYSQPYVYDQGDD